LKEDWYVGCWVVLTKFGGVPEPTVVKVELPDGEVEHRYEYVSIEPVPVRNVEKIPFSHPRQIFPVLKVPYAPSS
jgi:hypothetical protein